MAQQEVSSFDVFLIKKIIFNLIFYGILIFLGWYLFYFYSNPNLQNLIYFIILMFFLCFFASVILPQTKNFEIFLISAIWPASFFIFNFKKLDPKALSIGLFISIIFTFISFYSAKREENKTIEISFSRIFKNVWNLIFISIFLFAVTIFYFQNSDIKEGKFFVPQKYFEKAVFLLNPFLKELDKDFDSEKTIKEYILSKKLNLFGLDVTLPPNEFIKGLKENFKIEVKEEDKISTLIYLILKSKYESLEYNKKFTLLIILFLVITFLYEAIIVAISNLLGILASLIFWFFTLIGIFKIKAEPRGKEKITF
jgi:hypothetical protein